MARQVWIQIHIYIHSSLAIISSNGGFLNARQDMLRGMVIKDQFGEMAFLTLVEGSLRAVRCAPVLLRD